jgi:hypothetical protein
MSSTRASQSVRSADGTRIAFDRVGDGPPLILVEAALHQWPCSSHPSRTTAPDLRNPT